MADPTLANVLSGTNPTDPQILQGLTGAQQFDASLNPNVGHNEGPFGWLGKAMLNMGGLNAMRQGVQQTTAANTAAQPDLAKLLASPDPYGALAQGGYNPVAGARLLQGATPETAANARNIAMAAALAQQNVGGFNAMRTTLAGGGAGGAVPAGKNAGAAIGTGLGNGIVQGTGTPNPFTGAMQYPGQGASSYQQATGIDPVQMVMDPNTPPALQAKAVRAMTPAQKKGLNDAILAKMGGANATRPQP